MYFRHSPLIENIRNCDSQLIAKYHHRVDSRNCLTSQEITYRRGRQPRISGDLVGCRSSLLTQLFKPASDFQTFFFGVVHIHLPPLSYILGLYNIHDNMRQNLTNFLQKWSSVFKKFSKLNCQTKFQSLHLCQTGTHFVI